MRGWALVAIFPLLSGCTDPPAAAPATEEVIFEQVSPTVEESTWKAVTHANGSVALRVVVQVEAKSRCVGRFAAHYPETPLSEAWPYATVESDDRDVHNLGPHSRTLAAIRAKAGPADSRALTEPAGRATGGGRTVVTHQAGGFSAAAGQVFNLTAWAPNALDNGPGQAAGGSLSISMRCDGPMTVLQILEDRDSLWITPTSSGGDVEVQAFLPDAHRGSHEHETGGPTIVKVTAGGTGMADLRISGPIESEFHWDPQLITSQYWWDEKTWNGPAGRYRLEWTHAAIFGGFEFRIFDFEPLPFDALVESTQG